MAQVNDIIKNNFYGKLPDDDVLQRGAARGYVQAVGDQFTVFLDPLPANWRRNRCKASSAAWAQTCKKMKRGKWR